MTIILTIPSVFIAALFGVIAGFCIWKTFTGNDEDGQ
jgi:hypothetical protein